MKKFTLVFIALQICSSTINAQWSGDPQVADTKVCTANTNQNASRSIPDGSGGIIVFWHDQRDGSGEDIYIIISSMAPAMQDGLQYLQGLH